MSDDSVIVPRETLARAEAYLSLVRYRATSALDGVHTPSVTEVDKIISELRAVLYPKDPR